MIIRSYTAESVSAALKQVRHEMGGEAVVLKTRLVDGAGGGKQYEVTACLDKPTVQQAGAVLKDEFEAATASPEVRRPSPADNSTTAVAEILVPTDLEERLAAIERQLELLFQAGQVERIGLSREPGPSARAASAMQAADVPDHCIADFFEDLRRQNPTEPVDYETIRKRLIDRLEFITDASLNCQPGDRILVAGPAGAGKTSIIGRLAAKLTLEKRVPVKLVSLDNHKVGAAEEIASYADLLGVTDFAGPGSAHPVVESDADKVVLIDTCALPRGERDVEELKQKIQTLQPTHRLAVFSALMRSADVESYAQEMAWLEPTHLTLTMIDLTRRLGSLLAAASATGLKIAMLTNSSASAGALHAPDAAAIADIILGREEGRE